jgi:hypothetical protein
MNDPPTPTGRGARQLWELIPQVYRSRDRAEGGDLAELVAAFGTVLEGIRGTLDQRLAEVAPGAHHPAYPEPGDEVREAQDWLLPYVADLLDAHLRSPHPDGRRSELQRAVAWRKAKGTLPGGAEAAATVAQAVVEAREGRALVAVTPRVDLALLPERALTATPRDPDDTPAGQPLAAAGHPGLPTATPDVRRAGRAVIATPGDPDHHRRPAPAVVDVPRRLAASGDLDAGQVALVREVYTDAEVVAIARDGDVLALTRVPGVGELTAERIVDALAGVDDDVVWRHRDPRAAPCFGDTHEDAARRTPDARRPGGGHGRHHPRRLVVFHAPPAGFFPPPDHGVERTPPQELGLGAGGPHVVEGRRLAEVTVDAPGVHVLRRCVIGSLRVTAGRVLLDRVTVRGVIHLEAPGAHRLVDVVQLAGGDAGDGSGAPGDAGDAGADLPEVTVADGARLEVLRCALGTVTAGAGGAPAGGLAHDSDGRMPAPRDEADALVAVDSLLGAVEAAGRVTLDAVTVLTDLTAGSLRASEALLAGALTLTAAGASSCVRHSRLPRLDADARADLDALGHDLERHATTSRPPRFVAGLACDAPAHLAAPYGAAGCGVLADASPAAVTAGAEDGGELGAYHHRAHVAGVAAMAAKLADLLPVGIEPVAVQDHRLVVRPPEIEGDAP